MPRKLFPKPEPARVFYARKDAALAALYGRLRHLPYDGFERALAKLGHPVCTDCFHSSYLGTGPEGICEINGGMNIRKARCGGPCGIEGTQFIPDADVDDGYDAAGEEEERYPPADVIRGYQRIPLAEIVTQFGLRIDVSHDRYFTTGGLDRLRNAVIRSLRRLEALEEDNEAIDADD